MYPYKILKIIYLTLIYRKRFFFKKKTKKPNSYSQFGIQAD